LENEDLKQHTGTEKSELGAGSWGKKSTTDRLRTHAGFISACDGNWTKNKSKAKKLARGNKKTQLENEAVKPQI
jgi:hypothetical protein